MSPQTRFLRASAILAAATVILVLALCNSPAIATPIITNLDVLPGGNYSYSTSISADGSTVAGYSDSTVGVRADRRTSAGGMQSIGILSGGSYSESTSISSDGSVIAGVSAFSSGNNRAFRWTSAGGMQSLGVLGTGSASAAIGISSDGSVVAGFSYTSGFTSGRAFRWTSAGGMQNLGLLTGGGATDGSDAYGISADGSAITGYSTFSGLEHAFRWTSAGGMQDLGLFPGGDIAAGFALSGDGSAATGYSGDSVSNIFHAMRWTSAGGMQDLGVLTGGTSSIGETISTDGFTVLGSSDTASGVHAFLWKSSLGMVDLNTYLPSLGLDLTGWTLTDARGISADGLSIVGSGTFNGADRAFLITNVPEPASVVLAAFGFLGIAAWRRSNI
jgi:probable HAF family extracellular repeat protein